MLPKALWVKVQDYLFRLWDTVFHTDKLCGEFCKFLLGVISLDKHVTVVVASKKKKARLPLLVVLLDHVALLTSCTDRHSNKNKNKQHQFNKRSMTLAALCKLNQQDQEVINHVCLFLACSSTNTADYIQYIVHKKTGCVSAQTGFRALLHGLIDGNVRHQCVFCPSTCLPKGRAIYTMR